MGDDLQAGAYARADFEEPHSKFIALFNSLLAAYEPAEVRKLLREARLDNLAVREVSDRHLLVSGSIEKQQRAVLFRRS